MNKLKIITLFSGIGCQERGIENSRLFDLKVLNTSEIDKDAILSYAILHNNLTKELIENYKYPSKEDMIKELENKNIGYDFKKDKPFNWSRYKNKKLYIEKYWLACKLSNNLGDICKIDKLQECDLLTFSFPCQDISIAGKQNGIIKNKTSSGLIYEVLKLLKINTPPPKFLILENVKALVSKKFINDFNNLNLFFEQLGYNVYWDILNGKDCGIPQNRERVFGVYIRKDIDTKLFTFPKPFDNGLRMKDFLDEYVDEKYYLSDIIQNRLQITDNTFTKNIIGTTKPKFRTIGQRDLVYNQNGFIGTLEATEYKQPKQILDKVINKNNNINNIRVRKITSKECLRFMGFNDMDYNKIKNMDISDMLIYKQTGNGIITNCIKLIIEHLYKAQYDSTYICYDEKQI